MDRNSLRRELTAEAMEKGEYFHYHKVGGGDMTDTVTASVFGLSRGYDGHTVLSLSAYG